MQKLRSSLALTTLVAITACSGGQQRPRIPTQIIDRALANAPGEAQPSRIVATEIAWGRAAREQGQWTAFEAFAAPGALMHGPDGPFVAAPWLAAQKNPDEAVRWRPRIVWMSCDAKMAVSEGRFRDPAGIVGSYMTAWARQADGSYKWSYDVAAPDNPQPPPRADLPDDEEFDIVVQALEAIKGRVADCPNGEEPVGPIEPWTGAVGSRGDDSVSPDRTLRWSWFHEAPGIRAVKVAYWKDGAWETVLEKSFPALGETANGAAQ